MKTKYKMVLALSILCATVSQAEVMKCKDENGAVTYSNFDCKPQTVTQRITPKELVVSVVPQEDPEEVKKKALIDQMQPPVGKESHTKETPRSFF